MSVDDDGWVPVKSSKAGKFAIKVVHNEVKEKEPERHLALHTTLNSGSSSGSRCFDFDWADDVNEQFGDVPISPRQAEASRKNGEYFIEGNRYRYAQGASRQVPVFSIQTADRRYEYEDSVSTLGSPSVSPAVESPKQVSIPAMPVAQTPVQKQVWGKKSGKSRSRLKKHNLPTPAVRPAYEYEEALATMDDVMGQLPNAKNLLERVDPPAVEEDLWADFKKKPPRPIFCGDLA